MIEQIHISTMHWSSIAQLLNHKLFFRKLLSSSVYYSILDFVLYYLDWTINLAAIQFSISVRPSILFICFYKYLNIMQFPHFFYFRFLINLNINLDKLLLIAKCCLFIPVWGYLAYHDVLCHAHFRYQNSNRRP